MNNTEVKEKKKGIVKLTIGILSLAVLILGAAYAYWSASTMVNFNTAFISYETGGVATVVLDGTSAILRMDIVGSDMNKGSKNKVFYASTDGKKTEPTEEVIGIAYPLVNSIRSYKCNFTLNLSHTGQNDLIEKFLGETNDEPNYPNRSAGQIILTVNGVEYDLNDGFPSTISGYVITDSITNGTINVGMKFVNLKNVDQTDLANTDGIINIDVANNGFNCETVDGRTLYWAYEGKTTTSVTAQNKVDDYHKLYLDSGAIFIGSADLTSMFGWTGYFPTLADCNEYLSEQSSNLASEVQNVRCEQVTSNDYALTSVMSSYDTEADCQAAIGNSLPISCEYDSTDEKWIPSGVGRDSSLIYESQPVCEKKRDLMQSYYQQIGLSFITLSCDHPSNNNYYIKGDLVTAVNDITTCNDMVTTLEELEDINDILNVQLFAEIAMIGSNYRCELSQQNVFVKETIGLKEINDSNNVWQIARNSGHEAEGGTSSITAEGLQMWQDFYNSNQNNPNIENYNWYQSNNLSTLYRRTVVWNRYSHIISYDTLAECQDQLSEYAKYTINPSCQLISLNDYILESKEDSFDNENDCLAAIEYNYYCEYNSNDGTWDLWYPNDLNFYHDESNCELEISQIINYNPGEYRCNHPKSAYYHVIGDVALGGNLYTAAECSNISSEFDNYSRGDDFSNAYCQQNSPYRLLVDNYIYNYYGSQAECESSSFFNDSTINPRCRKNNTTTDYVVVNLGSTRYNSESQCLNDIGNNELAIECVYDEENQYWRSYLQQPRKLYSNKADCVQGIMEENYYHKCVHPNFEYYYLYLDNVDPGTRLGISSDRVYDNLYSCYQQKQRYIDSQNPRCIAYNGNTYTYDDVIEEFSFESEESCKNFLSSEGDAPIGAVRCKTKYENGTMMYDNTSEICGIIDGSVLCYAPEGITDRNIEATLLPYTNYFYCDFDNGALTCTNNDYEAKFTSEIDYYSSYLLDKNVSVGCGYDGNNISCFERVLPFTVESEHNPYPDNMNNKVYLERTFEGATSIEVQLTYQTESYYDDYITIYSGKNVYFGDYSSSSYTTTSLTIPSNYIRIEFYSDYNYNNYYGFSATITPKYDK